MILKSLHADIVAISHMAKDILEDIENQVGAPATANLPGVRLTEEALYTLAVCEEALKNVVLKWEALEEQLVQPSVAFMGVLAHVEDLHSAVLDFLGLEAREPALDKLEE